MARNQYITNGQITIEVDGAKVNYSMEVIKKMQGKLFEDLNVWLDYELQLLSKRAIQEGCTCSYMIHENRVSRLLNNYCEIHGTQP